MYITRTALIYLVTRATNLCPRRFRGRIFQRNVKLLKPYKSTSFKQPGGGLYAPDHTMPTIDYLNLCKKHPPDPLSTCKCIIILFETTLI